MLAVILNWSMLGDEPYLSLDLRKTKRDNSIIITSEKLKV